MLSNSDTRDFLPQSQGITAVLGQTTLKVQVFRRFRCSPGSILLVTLNGLATVLWSISHEVSMDSNEWSVIVLQKLMVVSSQVY